MGNATMFQWLTTMFWLLDEDGKSPDKQNEGPSISTSLRKTDRTVRWVLRYHVDAMKHPAASCVLLASTVWLLISVAACGGAPPVPKRGVVETDIGSWKFRRFQPVLDVEVWVADNTAEAFTASYVLDAAEKRGTINDDDLANVFVTRYQNADGVLRETVRFARRLAKEQGYQIDEEKIDGVRVFKITGNGEIWAMWAAKSYVVKIGGRGRKNLPRDLVEAYGDRYHSRLSSGMLEGPLPPGPEVKPATGSGGEKYDENNPKPDWENYDSKKPTPIVTPKPAPDATAPTPKKR
jgi:hypothetical protein